MLVCICIHLVTERAPTRRLPLPHCLWRAGRGGEGKEGHALPGWRLGWKDCCCGWLLLDLLAISRKRCSVAVSGICCLLCLTLTGKKIKQARKEVARHPLLSAGPACPAGAAQEEHLLLLRNATVLNCCWNICTCWFVLVCSLRLSPPTSGLAWSGHRRALSWTGSFKSSFYASRHRPWAWPGEGGQHSWTEIFLSTPLAADFGTGPEAERTGAQLDEKFCYTPLATDFGPGLDGAAGGRAGGRGVCFSMFLASNFALAWMRRWRGALPWRGVCLSIFHSLASRREAKLC